MTSELCRPCPPEDCPFGWFGLSVGGVLWSGGEMSDPESCGRADPSILPVFQDSTKCRYALRKTHRQPDLGKWRGVEIQRVADGRRSMSFVSLVVLQLRLIGARADRGEIESEVPLSIALELDQMFEMSIPTSLT